MSEDVGANEDQPWPCPACAFRAPTAALLAVHVRFVHVDPMFEEEAPCTWRCPSERCVDEAKVLPNAKRFADHLDRHDLPEKIAEHRRQTQATHRRAAVTRSEAARRAGKPPSAKRALRGRPRRRVPRARPVRRPRAMTPTRKRYVAAGIGKRPDHEVAKALGVSRQAVEAMRHVLAEMPGFEGLAVKRKKRKRGQVRRLLATRPIEELLALDWSQGNAALAPVLGLTPDDVGRLRWVLRNRGHVIPRSPRGRLGAVSRLLATRPIDELLALDWSRTNVAITAVLGLTENQVAELRTRLREEGHPVPKAKYGGQNRKPPSEA